MRHIGETNDVYDSLGCTLSTFVIFFVVSASLAKLNCGDIFSLKSYNKVFSFISSTQAKILQQNWLNCLINTIK